MGRIFVLSVIWLACSVLTSACGTMWYVAPAPAGADSNPGTPERPFGTIQKGIGTATDGDTVIVGEGTYVENIKFGGKNLVLQSTDPADQNVVGRTIIDGNKAGSVVTFSGNESPSCILSGFTLRNGEAPEGGGICGGTDDGHSHATIRYNIIYRNTAIAYHFSYGGGLCFCDGVVENNTIMSNGVFEEAEPFFGGGGGLAACNGTIRNNFICENSAYKGAGLYFCDGTVQDNLIAANSGFTAGGLEHCDGLISNNTIVDNTAFDSGGLGRCHGFILNCVIWGNRAFEASVAQLHECSAPTHCCIQDWGGGGEENVSGNPLFRVSGRWDDPGTPDDPWDDLWVEGDYHLQASSPCIDAGRNEDWMWRASDLDGNVRVMDGVVDMGAYEFGSFAFKATVAKSGFTGRMEVTWSSRPGDIYRVWSSPDILAPQWAEEVTLPSTGEATTWTDPDTFSPRKFYRIELK